MVLFVLGCAIIIHPLLPDRPSGVYPDPFGDCKKYVFCSDDRISCQSAENRCQSVEQLSVSSGTDVSQQLRCQSVDQMSVSCPLKMAVGADQLSVRKYRVSKISCRTCRTTRSAVRSVLSTTMAWVVVVIPIWSWEVVDRRP